MKKLLAMLLALSLSCTMLAGCGSEEDNSDDDDKEKVSSKKDKEKDKDEDEETDEDVEDEDEDEYVFADEDEDADLGYSYGEEPDNSVINSTPSSIPSSTPSSIPSSTPSSIPSSTPSSNQSGYSDLEDYFNKNQSEFNQMKQAYAGTGMDVKLYAEGNAMVCELTLLNVSKSSITQEMYASMDQNFEALKPTLKIALDNLKLDVPSANAIIYKYYDNSGSLIKRFEYR